MTFQLHVDTRQRTSTVDPAAGRFQKGAGADSLVAPVPALDGASCCTSRPEPGPVYTHSLHADLCVQAALRPNRKPREGHVQHVQVKLGQTVLCALVQRPWFRRDGQPMWSLDLIHVSGDVSTAHVPSYMVRQCSGLDGRCACAEARPGATGAAGAPGAVGAGCDVLVTRHNRLTGETA